MFTNENCRCRKGRVKYKVVKTTYRKKHSNGKQPVVFEKNTGKPRVNGSDSLISDHVSLV